MAGAETRVIAPRTGGRLFTRPLIVLLAVVIPLYAWIVTHGTWKLTVHEDYGQFFDHLAISLVHGRLDVPYEAVELEAVKIEGRFYGGWGPFPALLRLPLAITGGKAWVGHTSRIYAWVAATLSVIFMAALLRELIVYLQKPPLWNWFLTALLATAAIGSPLPFLLSHSYVFHESILWAGALVLGALVLGVRYLRQRQGKILVYALLVAGAAGITRPTLGCGALIGVGLIFAREIVGFVRGDRAPWLQTRPLQRLGGMALLAIVLLSLPFAYNYLRFGTLTGFPYDKYLLVTPERMAATHGGKFFHATNIWPNFVAYFEPAQIEMRSHFPFFLTKDYAFTPAQIIDYAEAFASVGASLTGLLLLAVAGFIFAGWRARPLLLLAAGALIGTMATCAFICLSERYLHDFFPLLFLGAGIGGIALSTVEHPLARLARIGLMVLFVFSAVEFAAITFRFQQAQVPTANDASRARYATVAANVDDTVAKVRRALFRLPLPNVVVSDWQHLPPSRPGTIARRLDPPGTLWHDGQAWRLISGICDEILETKLEVTLPPDDRPTTIPLLSVGRPNVATILFLRSDGSGRWTAACDLWGIAIVNGGTFQPPARTFSLTLLVDRVNERIRIRYNSNNILDSRTKAHPIAGFPVHLGENPFGGSHCAQTSAAVIRSAPASP